MDCHQRKLSHLMCIIQMEADSTWAKLKHEQHRIEASHETKDCKHNLLNPPSHTAFTAMQHRNDNSIQHEFFGLVDEHFYRTISATIPNNTPCSKKCHKCLVKQIIYEILDQMYHLFKWLENLMDQLIVNEICDKMAHAIDHHHFLLMSQMRMNKPSLLILNLSWNLGGV